MICPDEQRQRVELVASDRLPFVGTDWRLRWWRWRVGTQLDQAAEMMEIEAEAGEISDQRGSDGHDLVVVRAAQEQHELADAPDRVRTHLGTKFLPGPALQSRQRLRR